MDIRQPTTSHDVAAAAAAHSRIPAAHVWDLYQGF
jgi:hypothetical protein